MNCSKFSKELQERKERKIEKCTMYNNALFGTKLVPFSGVIHA